MELDSARALKAELLAENLWKDIATPTAMYRVAEAAAADVPLAARRRASRGWGRGAAGGLAGAARQPRGRLAIGIRGRRGQYGLAVRVQEIGPGLETVLGVISRRARREVDLRMVGPIHKQARAWHRKRNRPLRIGGSIGHPDVTAGTLGCFVSPVAQSDECPFVLSNNHVLANENDATRRDPILQPAAFDDGAAPDDVVARLGRFVRLRKQRNLVDAAVAELAEDMEYYYNDLHGLGTVRGVRQDPLDVGERVYKIGRTTGLTTGRVSAIEVDGLRVEYDMGTLEFNGQIEIEPLDNRPFSRGGDSGSLIVDRRHRAVALLFAGNDVDATYANPIADVLDSLHVRLIY
ncbi:MAG TPA: trypsin-like peptidase domain-containing protein [Thermoguttaceae bacterium]|nr:trypsin-like peptidase domain-containing protein [Thermoguttaceae bacterium]